MLKKDERILARLERENTKANEKFKGARPFDLAGENYEICFNIHEAMCWNDGSADIPANNEAAPRCFSMYFNDFSKVFSEFDRFTEIVIDRDEVVAAKRLAREQGANKRPWIYEFFNSEQAIGINPSYLLDHLDFCKTDRCYILKNGFNDDGIYTQPVFFVSDDWSRFSMVLPINIKGYKNKKESEAA